MRWNDKIFNCAIARESLCKPNAMMLASIAKVPPNFGKKKKN